MFKYLKCRTHANKLLNKNVVFFPHDKYVHDGLEFGSKLNSDLDFI